MRFDKRDYPELAIREALLNALVHRDYSVLTSTMIRLYSDRMEIISYGGLVPGIEYSDLQFGISVCRNPSLADVFYRLGLIEAYGRGLDKIRLEYKNENCTPTIETSKNVFKITLPNRNFPNSNMLNTPSTYFKNSDSEPLQSPVIIPRSDSELILEFINSHGSISRRETEKILQKSRATCSNILNQMIETGLLEKVGGGRSTRYAAK